MIENHNIPDDKNINYVFSNTDTDILVQILSEKTDILYYVKKELALRGKDRDGIYVGFEKAKKIHNIIL